MRAVHIRESGGPEVLELRESPDPEPPHGHVRVAVRYAGVNRADLLQRIGAYPAPKGAVQDVPGLEYSGVVDALGAGVSSVAVGDRVYGLTAGGAYADKLLAHEHTVVPIPESLSDEEAAAIPEAFVTAYDAMVEQGQLAPGEQVLIHAIGSGVGTAGCQIAKALGCRVIGTSRTPAKLERAAKLGMDEGVLVDADADHPDVGKRVAELSGGGVDLVLDLLGGRYTAEALVSTAKRGRVVVVGLTAGSRSDLNLALLLGKRLSLTGTVLRSRPLEEKIAAARLLRKNLGAWIAGGRLQPVIEKVFPLAKAAEAHELMASNTTFGKVLLRT